MAELSKYQPHRVTLETRDDGTMLYRSGYDMGDSVRRTGDWLHLWAKEAPERVFLAERSGAGWREERYGAVLDKVRAIAEALLARGLNAETPILILSGNGVDHGLLSLAGQYAGIPTVPVAEQYSLIHGAHGRLRHAIELIRPKMAYIVDADQYGEALALDAFEGIDIVASRTHGRPGVTAFDDLLRGDRGVDVDGAFDALRPESVVKILMTSGSTSAPKGVMTTHGMMCANQAMIADALPFLKARPPVIVDWLPWNHVFGGSHNFNMMLANGGALYIDEGKPVKGLFERTVENLRLKTGTLSFNVPVGFGLLLKALEGDAGLRQRYFEDLDMIFYAGASLPQDIWDGLQAMAREVRGDVPLMTSSWGLTETAPATMIQHEPTERSGVVGVPMTGVTLKLVPDDEMRCEVRVRGPNVMPGYFRNIEKTQEAFDEEGFFLTGDAMRFVDRNDPARGMRFDGRISEDFKLSTGTWVRAAQLRLDMLTCLAPLAAELVITGADRDEIGVMVFPNLAELEAEGFDMAEADGALSDALLLGEIRRRLAARDREVSGSSSRVARAIVLAEPASMAESEMTAKGNLNYRRILERRKALLDRLYAAEDAAVVRI
ncbi:feruloyl-CoA synthase [Shimia aestuarii]|uniref:Feruloyl-CoA synthase n=1 Tax=Shimia aestuarii TaxID=254406 RepID=A0A1I4LB62_9RHOB|nr:feruloyl-CoA synthase [Shimia aestuarii]SFL88242.1 feruloyl-CoA synthase [Shimia aestuarii]